MPLKLKAENKDLETALDIVEFISKTEENSPYFRVKNLDNVGININYIPTSDCDWDKERFEIQIFENPYLNAENDVFEVYESSLDERIGWIFPITILESNENDFVDTKNLNNYKFIAYKKLLEQNKTVIQKENFDEFYKLSDIFKDSIICLFNKNTTNKIPEFDFKNYILSFYDYGYLILDIIPKSKSFYDKTNFLNVMRNERKRIVLKKSNFNIYDNDFTKSLFFKEHLLQSDSYLVRFIFLYQIIEYFMSIEFDKQFELCLEDYKNKNLVKNDLKENIMTLSKERTLIRDVLNRISLNQELKQLFLQECKFLFEDIDFTPKKDSLPDKIYDLRNLVVHRLRELTSKQESLEKILEVFERLIIDILINYESEDGGKKAELAI